MVGLLGLSWYKTLSEVPLGRVCQGFFEDPEVVLFLREVLVFLLEILWWSLGEVIYLHLWKAPWEGLTFL